VNRQKSRGEIDTNVKADPRWHTMLADVNSEIEKAARHLSDLEQSKRIITGGIKANEPFPEFASTNN
jgi:hypothetical protein